ncbi:hypothetical protein AQUCO_05700009v1 [Aquilegia coerulea]|uniref:Protein FLX-like 1 n=1 Tax=Aquilegia coerulea TaxID=218851 RepID=A0A2G5CFI4_AQUCA|nr:hypothetical protein AQUCO_05700009v1 [Aquilegia coerulea]PIA30011.1 hypothetical protein AQUCO_05700009v1 [Aquilegia coerulea]
MAGRNHRGLKGPPIHEQPPFGRLQTMPHHHPAILEEMREVAQFGGRRGGGGGDHGHQMLPPHHPVFIEERLAAQHQEIQGLLGDNQRLAATHVALKQELEAATHELQRMAHIADSLHAEKDIQLREVYEKSMKMEAEIHGIEGMKAEVIQVRSDVQKLSVVRQELTTQVQGLSQDLTRVNADLQKVPALRADIETMKQELERARVAIDYERKGHAERYDKGQAMENNLILIAREVEKLRAEVANGEMRVRAAASVGNPGYSGNYTNPEPGYGGNPYSSGYGMNPVQNAAEGAAQYGPGPAAWGGYDMQRAPGHR